MKNNHIASFTRLAFEIQKSLNGSDINKILRLWAARHPEMYYIAAGSDCLMNELHSLTVKVWDRCQYLREKEG